METLTEQRLLIFTNDQETNRILNDAKSRAELLNRLNLVGVTNDEIKSVCSSVASIDDYIFKRVLNVNDHLNNLHSAGIKVEYTVPAEIQAIKYALLAWFNYPSSRGISKFENLIYSSKWEVDEQGLESYFVRSNLKIYIQGEKLAEYKEIETICKYLEAHKAPNNQIAQTSFFHTRIECVGQSKFKPKWQYFKD